MNHNHNSPGGPKAIVVNTQEKHDVGIMFPNLQSIPFWKIAFQFVWTFWILNFQAAIGQTVAIHQLVEDRLCLVFPTGPELAVAYLVSRLHGERW